MEQKAWTVKNYSCFCKGFHGNTIYSNNKYNHGMWDSFTRRSVSDL